MAFVPIPRLCTGWEVGHVIASSVSNATISTDFAHTGTYSVKTDNSGAAQNSNITWILPTGTNPSTLYCGVWFYSANATGYGLPEVRVATSDSNASVCANASNILTLQVNAVVVATGTTTITGDGWHHLNCKFFLDAAGTLEVYLDGLLEVTYTGDTLSAASAAITQLMLRANGTNGIVYWDDCTPGTGAYPNDVRYEALVVNSDIAAGWTPSTGLTNYGVVDEIPPNDTDYLSSSVNGDVSTMGLSDWTGTDKRALWVTTWARALKTVANGNQLTQQQSDSVTTVEQTSDISTTFAYYAYLRELDPSGSAWTTSSVNALRAGLKSVVV